MIKTFIVFLSLFKVIKSLAQPNQVSAQTRPWGQISGYCVQYGVATIQGVACLVANLLAVSLTFIGLAGFIMLIIGSLKWLLSGGSSQSIESAKKTITFAVIGLIVALSSFMIINLIARFTGINVLTEFFIPGSETGLTDPSEWERIGQ